MLFAEIKPMRALHEKDVGGRQAAEFLRQTRLMRQSRFDAQLALQLTVINNSKVRP